MRHLSQRRQAQLPTEQQFREELFARAGFVCEFCGDEPASEQHEIGRGASRLKARTALFASLALGVNCHRVLHRMASDDAVALGLAIIRVRRPEDYSLSDFHRLTARRWPDQRQVDEWAKRLSVGCSIER